MRLALENTFCGHLVERDGFSVVHVRLNWKVIARYKHSSLFGLVVCNKEICFITLTPVANVIKLFTAVRYACP